MADAIGGPKGAGAWVAEVLINFPFPTFFLAAVVRQMALTAPF
jgi:hypothetical protein